MARDVVVITNVQLHSTKPELESSAQVQILLVACRRFEILWQWSRLEIRLNSFRRSTIPQKAIQFKLIAPFDINILDWFSIKVRRSDTSLPYLSKITLFSQNSGIVFAVTIWSHQTLSWLYYRFIRTQIILFLFEYKFPLEEVWYWNDFKISFKKLTGYSFYVSGDKL